MSLLAIYLGFGIPLLILTGVFYYLETRPQKTTKA